MGPIAARDLRAIQNLADHLLAISLLAAAQATDATNRAAALPAPIAAVYTALRAICSATIDDRRHDDLIARCLATYHAGTLPI
jgi:histidine ammonia-lyase